MYPQASIAFIFAFIWAIALFLVHRYYRHQSYLTAQTQQEWNERQHEVALHRALARQSTARGGWQLDKQQDEEKYETVNWIKEGF